MLWHLPVTYREDPEQPATLLLRTVLTEPDDPIENLYPLSMIRAAGVGYEMNIVIPDFDPWVNEPDDFLLHRFIQSLAFSNLRNRTFPVFDGTILFDGSALFDTVAESLFHFPRFQVRGAMPGISGQFRFPSLRFDGYIWSEENTAAIPGLRILFPGFSNRRGIAPHPFDGSVLFDGESSFGVTASLSGFPRFLLRGTLGAVTSRFTPASFRQRFRLSEFPGVVAQRMDGSALFDGSARFDQQGGGMLWLPHFRVTGTSFSNRRGIVPHPFDGTALFNGECSFGVTASLFHFPRFRQRTGAGIHANRLGHAALTADSLWSFDGSAGFDGALRFNADITQEEI
ncbi:MAG: hypothetical protein IJ601_12395 [Acidaminococcaceae bacterium]|nr:hypothetical protein [Acidaminococcaceae bacterium]